MRRDNRARPGLLALGGYSLMARRFKSRGVSRTALAALLVAQPLATAPLLAQAFQGLPTTTFGSVTYDRTVAGVDIITLGSSQATINWTPSDTGTGAIDFLPSGTTANYVNSGENPAGGTILNRIIAADPTRTIAFNGAVNSAANIALWYYAPGGILVGSTGRFNIGSLLLTASDPVAGGDGSFIQNGNQFSLSAATNGGAGINIAAGAQINALAAGSYVIAVAPQITQAGSIAVNGSAALVAADAVDFTLNAGLFDINVTQGTSAAGEVFSHTGTTTGPAAVNGANQRIYLVAVPKNDAITMFVGGGTQLGFDIAGSADVVGNTIILSAGHNVIATPNGDPFSDTPVNVVATADGEPFFETPVNVVATADGEPFFETPVNAVQADIRITDGNYTSALTARATNSASLEIISAVIPASANFASDLSLRGGTAAAVAGNDGSTGSGALLTVGGNLLISAEARYLTTTSLTRTGGNASLQAATGLIVTIEGDLTVTAGAQGDAGGGGDAVGGTAIVSVSAGTLGIGGNLSVLADVVGGSSIALGGNAVGGSASVTTFGMGSEIIIGGGQARLSASAVGGNGDIDTGVGGTATGGLTQLLADNGSIRTTGIDGDLRVYSNASGGVAASGGNALGGQVNVNSINGGSISTVYRTFLYAMSEGGLGRNGNGGNASGGDIGLMARSGGIFIAGDAQLLSLGDIALGAASAVITIGGALTVDAGGSVFSALDASTLAVAGLVSAASVSVVAAGSIDLASALNSLGGASFDGGGAIMLGDVEAAGAVRIAAQGDLFAGGIRSGGGVELRARATAVQAASITAGNVYAIGSVAIDADGSLTIGAIDALGSVGMVSRGAMINVGAITAGPAVILLAGTGVSTAGIETGTEGTTYVGSDSMASLVIDGISGNPDFTALLAATPMRLGGDMLFGGTVNTGRFTVAGTGGFSGQTINAGQSVTIDSGGIASFASRVAAPVIAVTSADIVIGGTAALGTATTNQLTLNIASTVTAIRLGGSANPGGYSLDNAEAGRLSGHAITIAALGSNPATMAVETLSLSGTGLSTGGNSFTLRTPGTIRVDGALTLTGAGAGDTLALQAGQRIEVATDSGGKIALTSSGDTLAGTLDMAAGSIWVGTSVLLGQLAQDLGFGGRDALLAQEAATPNLVGALAAGRISVAAQGSFLVQNSGSLGQKAGFSAGSGGFSISAVGSTPLDVVVNGRALDATSMFLINQRTIEAITFVSGDSIGFTTTSTVNTCVIGNICGLAPARGGNVVAAISTNVAELTEANQPTTEEQREEAKQAAEKLPQMRISRLIDLSSAIDDVTVSDPVTGDGNPALWIDVPASAAGASGELK